MGADACKTTEVVTLDPTNYEVNLKTQTRFHKFRTDVFTTQESKELPYPQSPKANTYLVTDLLRMANLKVEEVTLNGAIIIINVLFTCELDDGSCEMNVEAVNVDSKSGYQYAHNHYYEDEGTGERMKDTYRMYGIRIASFGTANGSMVSFAMIVLQVSSAIALLGVAQTAADFFLQNIVPERRHYIAQKVIQTEDFNAD